MSLVASLNWTRVSECSGLKTSGSLVRSRFFIRKSWLRIRIWLSTCAFEMFWRVVAVDDVHDDRDRARPRRGGREAARLHGVGEVLDVGARLRGSRGRPTGAGGGPRSSRSAAWWVRPHRVMATRPYRGPAPGARRVGLAPWASCLTSCSGAGCTRTRRTRATCASTAPPATTCRRRAGGAGSSSGPTASCSSIGPGPADKPQAAAGRWEPAGERRARVSLPAGEPQELEIVSVEPDRLKLRWSLGSTRGGSAADRTPARWLAACKETGQPALEQGRP